MAGDLSCYGQVHKKVLVLVGMFHVVGAGEPRINIFGRVGSANDVKLLTHLRHRKVRLLGPCPLMEWCQELAPMQQSAREICVHEDQGEMMIWLQDRTNVVQCTLSLV